MNSLIDARDLLMLAPEEPDQELQNNNSVTLETQI